ncbi:MAG: toprim domain-containing protein [Nocardioidaceae bacterium]
MQHLRRHGVTGQEMLAAGVATTASTGHLIDRFRDRVVFPITHHGDVLGFVGRRHPDVADDDNSGPKYLNTADTALFQKGAQLFVAGEKYQDAGAIPVIVEGPMDAIAITIATGGTHVGVAPLGTSLTEEQAAQLGSLGRLPIVATDGDLAGQVAAERDFWMLTPFGLDPLYAQLPTGSDPADLMARRGPEALVKALSAARPLADVLINERLANLPPKQARLEAVRVVAALPPTRWDRGTDQISGRLRGSTEQTRRDLRSAVHAWNRDARKAAQQPLQQIGEVRARLVAAAAQRPHERWIALANELDPRLVHQGDWPALAAVIQDVHDQGHDVAQAARSLISEAPLTELPAQDLRYRLVARLAIDVEDHEMPASPTRPTAASKIRPRPGSPGPRPSGAFECRRQRR